jgi:putative membrane protein
MFGFILRMIGSAILVFFCSYLLDGVTVTDFWTALWVALILGLVNAVIRPILLILTLPINVMTLGLFTFIINAFMIVLVDWMVSGFNVANFWWALALSLVMGIVSGIMSFFLKDD